MLHPGTKHGAAPVGRGGRKEVAKLASSFVDDTAEKTGQSTRKIHRDAQRGEEIGTETLSKVVGTSHGLEPAHIAPRCRGRSARPALKIDPRGNQTAARAYWTFSRTGAGSS